MQTTDGKQVIGAIGANTREDEIVIFRAKTVILGTGSAIRLYPASNTPAWLFNTRLSPTCVGDGRAMAYRAGADLVACVVAVIEGFRAALLGTPIEWQFILPGLATSVLVFLSGARARLCRPRRTASGKGCATS